MDHRDRAAPGALAGDAPVAQAPRGPAGAAAALLEFRDGGALGFVRCREAVQEIGVDDAAKPGPGLVADAERGRVLALGQHHGRNGQAVFAGEVEVALVVRGAAENGPGAVFHQHEIGDPDRIRLAGERVADTQPGVPALLLRRLDRGLGRAAGTAFRDEGGDRRILRRQRRRDRVLGGDGEETHAEQRVRARGEDDDGILARDRGFEAETYLRAIAAADPVGLHQAHAVRPAVHRGQRVEQFGGVFRDAQAPLPEATLFHHGAGAPAAPVDHLLVGQHRLVHRVPVYQRGLAIQQAGAVEGEQQALLLAVILGIAGGELARPVERKAHALHPRLHGGDVGVGPFARAHAAFARGVVRGQAERVPAHRVHHVAALRAAEARHQVALGVVPHMPHMDLARWVGEHFEDVVFSPAGTWLVLGAEKLLLRPCRLPARLVGAKIVAGGRLGRSRVRAVHDGFLEPAPHRVHAVAALGDAGKRGLSSAPGTGPAAGARGPAHGFRARSAPRDRSGHPPTARSAAPGGKARRAAHRRAAAGPGCRPSP